MRRLLRALRHAANHPDPAIALAEAWVADPHRGSPLRAPTARSARSNLGPRDLDEFDRLITWLTSPTARARAFPGNDAIDDQIVALYADADAPRRAEIREHLAAMLDAPAARPAEVNHGRRNATTELDHALRLAGRIPVPRARERLLCDLTSPRRVPSNGDDNAPAAATRLRTDHNARAAQVIRALGRLGDAELRTVFVALIERYAPLTLWDPAAMPILHQAGWALCRLDSQAFTGELPFSLQADPLFLQDVTAEPAVRPVVERWLGTLPSERAALLRPHVASAAVAAAAQSA